MLLETALRRFPESLLGFLFCNEKKEKKDSRFGSGLHQRIPETDSMERVVQNKYESLRVGPHVFPENLPSSSPFFPVISCPSRLHLNHVLIHETLQGQLI